MMIRKRGVESRIAEGEKEEKKVERERQCIDVQRAERT
jgi:hypothetical protein